MMFRITKAFENETVTIYRVEGKVTEEQVSHWSEEIKALTKRNHRQMILDFCQVWFIGSAALEMLVSVMSERLYLLNCSIEIRNVMQSMGFSNRLI